MSGVCIATAAFSHSAGDLTVRGPTSGENQACTAGIVCTLGPFSGTGLTSDDQVALVPDTGTCGVDAKDVVANIARGSFLPVTLTSGSTEVSLVSADLPKGGYWKICYCATDELCTQTIDYGNTAGALSVRGASGVQTFNCVKEVQCGIQVAGTLLDTTDYVQAVTATCGGANVAQFLFAGVPPPRSASTPSST